MEIIEELKKGKSVNQKDFFIKMGNPDLILKDENLEHWHYDKFDEVFIVQDDKVRIRP